jgi:hypothetical protein
MVDTFVWGAARRPTGPNAVSLSRAAMNQRREMFPVDEDRLLRFFQPVKHFVDEQHVGVPASVGEVHVSADSAKITAQRHETL